MGRRGCSRNGPPPRGIGSRTSPSPGSGTVWGTALAGGHLHVPHRSAAGGQDRDVVGLYLHPLQRAVALGVDEKPQLQALERAVPGLPVAPGQPERQTFDDDERNLSGMDGWAAKWKVCESASLADQSGAAPPLLR